MMSCFSTFITTVLLCSARTADKTAVAAGIAVTAAAAVVYLVFGATGGIGSALAHRLAKSNTGEQLLLKATPLCTGSTSVLM